MTLYPDKGEHRTSGYPIKPSMTLELRLVEQGSQTNFPVLFSAKNSKTDEKLLIDGETTYVTTPTETSDPVLDAVITAVCEYIVSCLIKIIRNKILIQGIRRTNASAYLIIRPAGPYF